MSPSGLGDDHYWMSCALPALPYAHVARMYPRNEMHVWAPVSRPQPPTLQMPTLTPVDPVPITQQMPYQTGDGHGQGMYRYNRQVLPAKRTVHENSTGVLGGTHVTRPFLFRAGLRD